MTTSTISTSVHDLAALVPQGLSLWVSPEAASENLRDLLSLPWTTIWDASGIIANQLDRLCVDRTPLIISRPDQDNSTFRTSEFTKIYDVSLAPDADLRRKRAVEHLKDSVEAISGLICVLGPLASDSNDIDLITQMAPNVTILLLGCAAPAPQPQVLVCEDLGACLPVLRKAVRSGATSPRIDLRDSIGVRLDSGLLEDIAPSWTVLTTTLMQRGHDLEQADFDRFLSGDLVWPVYLAGGAYRRRSACTFYPKDNTNPGDRKPRSVDFVEEVLRRAETLEKASVVPSEQLEQVLLFSEPGSGTTTLLRQVAIELATSGFPTLLANPFSRNLAGRSLEKFIVSLQNAWTEKRNKPSGASGPVCLIIDTDSDAVFSEHRLARTLQALGRKVLLVRALHRSEAEIEVARGVYVLNAEVDADEVVSIGTHLSEFSLKHALASVPSKEEWLAYHEGIERLARHTSKAPEVRIPSLFLIGIYPFVKDRVADESSLEQYYYRAWQSIADNNGKRVVEVLAAAGAYGLSVPYDTLRRDPDIDIVALATAGKEVQRALDVFVSWHQEGYFSHNWYLHIRHPTIALLLARTLYPAEELAPYSALLPMLRHLSSNEDDLWFAGALAFRLGRNFKSRAPQFSLETDTAPQRAARTLFQNIPVEVRALSRTVLHHQGRYHLHVLRACIDALEKPHQSSLTRAKIVDIAEQQFASCTSYLQEASQAKDDFEPLSNVLNTLATAHFALARALGRETGQRFTQLFDDALSFEERALKQDPANGHALYQYVDRVIHEVSQERDAPAGRRVDLLARAELRLCELIRLHGERRWRNSDPVEAEVQLGTLVEKLRHAVNDLGSESVIDEFKAKNPEASIVLLVRATLRNDSLERGFTDLRVADRLRKLRTELESLPQRAPFADLYLYRLYLADPRGRLEFDRRLEILERLRRVDPEQFLPFRHDEACLHCQVDHLDIGARKLESLNQYRNAHRAQWFWRNEQALVDPSGQPRILTFEVRDPVGGWANVHNTRIRVKFQPYHFGDQHKGQVFRAYLRFTLDSLQAIPKDLVARDLQDMGLT